MLKLQNFEIQSFNPKNVVILLSGSFRHSSWINSNYRELKIDDAISSDDWSN